MCQGDNNRDPNQRSVNRLRTAVVYIVLTVLGLSCVVLLACIAVNASASQLTSSEGELCGHGNQTGKPNLLNFDLVECSGLSAAEDACPTRQVRVAECPRIYWTFAQGKSPDLEQFCDSLIRDQLDFSTTSLSQLVDVRLCPAYLLPSIHVLGRCIPTVALEMNEDTDRAETKMKAIKRKDGKVLTLHSLMGGVDYLLKSFDIRSHGEKLLACLSAFWSVILVAFLLSLVLSLSSKFQIRMTAKSCIWTGVLLCFTILVNGCTSWFMFIQIVRDTDNIFLPSVISTSSSLHYTYWQNKITWLVCFVINTLITIILCIVLCLNGKKIERAFKSVFIANIGLVVATASFAIVAMQGSSLDMYLNLHIGLILIVIVGSIAGVFFSLYGMTVCILDDVENQIES